jgi:hypothetical protein
MSFEVLKPTFFVEENTVVFSMTRTIPQSTSIIVHRIIEMKCRKQKTKRSVHRSSGQNTLTRREPIIIKRIMIIVTRCCI